MDQISKYLIKFYREDISNIDKYSVFKLKN